MLSLVVCLILPQAFGVLGGTAHTPKSLTQPTKSVFNFITQMYCFCCVPAQRFPRTHIQLSILMAICGTVPSPGLAVDLFIVNKSTIIY